MEVLINKNYDDVLCECVGDNCGDCTTMGADGCDLDATCYQD